MRRLQPHLVSVASVVDVIIRCVSLSCIELDKDEETRYQKVKKAFKPLDDYLISRLDGKVGRIMVSKKLVDDAVAMSSERYGASAYGERVMRGQTFSSFEARSNRRSRVLEINPKHPLIQKMLDMVKVMLLSVIATRVGMGICGAYS